MTIQAPLVTADFSMKYRFLAAVDATQHGMQLVKIRICLAFAIRHDLAVFRNFHAFDFRRNFVQAQTGLILSVNALM